jgi:hypothetical protein
MIVSAQRRRDPETRFVITLATFAALAAFAFYFQHGCLLLYGDAVAHINIARRVFDSRTPGPLQLGTVWLPLPHLLIIPFIVSFSSWTTGLGGSVPSLAAYVAGVAGIFRLVRTTLSAGSAPDVRARLTAWLAAAIYGANPNLIYLQSTAMTETLYLALFVWSVVFFAEFVRAAENADVKNRTSPLLKCGLCLMGAELTRYDGWFAAAVMLLSALVIVVWKNQEGQGRLARALRLQRFVLVAAVAPVLWLAYNAAIYRNPLEFANGPYSARAIEQKSAVSGFPPHPGAHDLRAATQYFVKAAELNLAEGNWQKLWVLLSMAGVGVVLVRERRLAPLLLLWIPLPFYILSVAYAGTPVFVPVWWPFSYYNVRYGIELLPAAAVFFALTVSFLAKSAPAHRVQAAIALAGVAFVVLSYALVWRAQPVCFREAWTNSRSRLALETELAANLRRLPANSTLLMYLGDHVGALQQAGIPLRRVINEGNHRTWKQPADPGGLWERALADPQKLADFAIGIGDDPVEQSARRNHLQSILVVQALGQPRATIYFTRAAPRVISQVNRQTP